MSLPLLPGNTFSSNPGRENFSKSHHFDVCNAINMNVGEYKVSDPRTHLRLPVHSVRTTLTCRGSLIKPGIGGEILPGQKFKQHSIYPKSHIYFSPRLEMPSQQKGCNHIPSVNAVHSQFANPKCAYLSHNAQPF